MAFRQATAAHYCLWTVGVLVLVALAFLLCNTMGGKKGCGGGALPGGSACSSSGKMAQRGQVLSPPSLRGARATTTTTTVAPSADVPKTTAGELVRTHTGLLPSQDKDAEACQSSKGADMSQFLPKSLSINGNKKGANTRAHQMSESGRLDYASLARTIGLNDRAWLPQVSIQLGGGCVSFNDSEMRQTAIMSLTNCDQNKNCPFPPNDTRARS